MKKTIFLLFISLMLYSCETATLAGIINQKNEDITVKIYYNTNSEKIQEYLNQHKSFESFSKFILKYNNTNFQNKISVNSNESSASIKIKKNDTLIIWGGLHQSKDFNEIKKVEIFILDKEKVEISGSNISDVFEKKDGGLYLFTVK